MPSGTAWWSTSASPGLTPLRVAPQQRQQQGHLAGQPSTDNELWHSMADDHRGSGRTRGPLPGAASVLPLPRQIPSAAEESLARFDGISRPIFFASSRRGSKGSNPDSSAYLQQPSQTILTDLPHQDSRKSSSAYSDERAASSGGTPGRAAPAAGGTRRRTQAQPPPAGARSPPLPWKRCWNRYLQYHQRVLDLRVQPRLEDQRDLVSTSPSNVRRPLRASLFGKNRV
ncbi:hypothetical protein CEXT_670361 [Caerostris extrusa]|uniref:Uncharacterized protein n=1 Tax=Caerostris extrusa TaxID=172846 RepID=A0AAV4WG74_CAEEX|nr:hypothetical protein CEXT_670361 [Caerostris extrusa]